MNTITILGWTSFILAMASYLCGVYAIIYRSVRPSMISRFFWLTLSITNLLSYISIGAGSGIFLALANTLGSAAIFFLSLRFGHIEFKRTDLLTIAGACAALLCYIFVSMKLIALVAG